jgi:RNA polymerase sigma factor (sigma-70 family)
MDVSDEDNSATGSGGMDRQRQKQVLSHKEPELRRLAAERNREEFFHQIVPLLGALKGYIKRRLRIAYLTSQIRTPVNTSGDILDETVLQAYRDYVRRPRELSLEQWLYQIANRKLERYISKQKSREARHKSLETLSQAELATLEEMPITADTEGEIWLPEDLDDSEYAARNFDTPADGSNPEGELERREKLRQILEALCRLPERDRLVFDLVAIEGFSHDSASKILDVPRDEIRKVVKRAKMRLREHIQGEVGKTAGVKRKAS